jgi:hypothetical protein
MPSHLSGEEQEQQEEGEEEHGGQREVMRLRCPPRLCQLPALPGAARWAGPGSWI